MQIDFHHAVTYVAARIAGFSEEEASIVAHSAQYVDDATNSGAVSFDNGAMFHRISSAHKMLDLSNLNSLANHQVWIPFHFLPANGNKKKGKNPEGRFINKIICKPNSYVAQDMVRNAILEKNKKYGLHHFGVVMHVYADTWAHQGFAGVLNDINEVEDSRDVEESGSFGSELRFFLRDLTDDLIPPLGHGRAENFPDLPFLRWEYKNGKGNRIFRDNPNDFLEAANELCKSMQRYVRSDPDAHVEGIGDDDLNRIKKMLSETKAKDSEARHRKWQQVIERGYFSFGRANISYKDKGRNSWKHEALGTSFDVKECRYNDSFLNSNWKLFHDAIMAHRFYIIHDLLPQYGMCCA